MKAYWETNYKTVKTKCRKRMRVRTIEQELGRNIGWWNKDREWWKRVRNK